MSKVIVNSRFDSVQLVKRRLISAFVDLTLACLKEQVIRENPGGRILLITGIENCPNIRTELRRNKKVNLIEMETWLRANMN